VSWHRRRPTARPPLNAPDEGARPATDGTPEPMPRLPHERDEHAEAPKAPTRPMRLAHEDLEEGRVDTDCRGSPTGRDCTPELPALLKRPPHTPARQ
jgi:hypothetical protein